MSSVKTNKEVVTDFLKMLVKLDAQQCKELLDMLQHLDCGKVKDSQSGMLDKIISKAKFNKFI